MGLLVYSFEKCVKCEHEIDFKIEALKKSPLLYSSDLLAITDKAKGVPLHAMKALWGGGGCIARTNSQPRH
jgi:hypothetical protein